MEAMRLPPGHLLRAAAGTAGMLHPLARHMEQAGTVHPPADQALQPTELPLVSRHPCIRVERQALVPSLSYIHRFHRPRRTHLLPHLLATTLIAMWRG